MRKLLQAFKNLPPELRMVIAMAGLGTPIGLVYVLSRYTGMSTKMILIVLMAVLGLIFLLGFLFSKLFGRVRKQRGRRMESALAGEAETGRVSMDVAAAIKANNEKFFTAIRDMRKNLKIDVYDLPWYIVIGDSGCGKTRLVNEGGLTFSTGKPEGYQLGTLNYNWWFTEDAIFIDMAGRLCNPQEDADRREWEAFLGSVAKGRQGFPINGALVCVSADHLLQDSPEQIEQDANTTLERLRDLQTRLGVTFASYLIVTKCDKLLGFMQFFDRAERDITFKNQVFGWSRPGDFDKLYDPEAFGADFEKLYGRLNELGLRRLQDESDEVDLGLAYSFPGEFRQLLPPLQTYLRTLFPMIKNPRAIKNLIFRGVYFTSATQEGGLILKHLTERLGEEAAAQFPPLDDLYPTKRPHFIKDLLFKKVFPEYGLVFRNEQQVRRNQKVTQFLRWGSPALLAILALALLLSWYKFGHVIEKPRADAEQARPQNAWMASGALQMGGSLGGDIRTLEANMFWARVLSLGIGASRPREDLKVIQAGLFERSLLRQALVDVGEALKSTQLENPFNSDEARARADRYLGALEQYLAWYGCADRPTPPEQVNLESFQKLWKVVPDQGSPLKEAQDEFLDQAANYFNVIHSGGQWHNPARLLKERDVGGAATVAAALRRVHDYWAIYARLDAQNPDADIREWMRIHGQCRALSESYSTLLDAAGGTRDTLERFQAFREEFDRNYQRFAQGIGGLAWRPGDLDRLPRIPSLWQALLRQRGEWLAYQNKLEAACKACGTPPDDSTLRLIRSLSTGDESERLAGVDRVLWDALVEAELADRPYKPEYFEEKKFAEVVKEVYERYSQVIAFLPGEGTAADRISTTPDVSTVNDVLAQINTALQRADFAAVDDRSTPREWIDKLDAFYAQQESEPGQVDLEGVAEFWRGGDLANLYAVHQDEIARVGLTRLLGTMAQRLERVGPWGFAELVSGADMTEKIPSSYSIATPDVSMDREAPVRPEPLPEEAAPPRRRSGRREFGQRRSRQPRETRETPAPSVTAARQFIPACASQTFLLERAKECEYLLYSLAGLEPGDYLTSGDRGDALHELCMGKIKLAGGRYMATYVEEWSKAYQQKQPRELEHLLAGVQDWQGLAELMAGRHRAGSPAEQAASEMRYALSEILEALPYWSYEIDDAGKWVSVVEGDSRTWREVDSWMSRALQDEWPAELGDFAAHAVRPTEPLEPSERDAAPWEGLTRAFVRRWEGLCDAVAANARLPNQFEPGSPQTRLQEIPWGQIEALRREARLADEKFTGALAGVESWAQRVLSAALTNTLCDVQRRHLGDDYSRVSGEGWPYSAGGGGLATVNFARFKRFVGELAGAADALSVLEQNLPQDDVWTRRHTFYNRCREWHAFLGLKATGVPEPLPLTVQYGDPIDEESSGKVTVQDTAQNYYRYVELDLGLEIQQSGGSFRVESLKAATQKEEIAQSGPVRALWKWDPQKGGDQFVVRLVGGYEPWGKVIPDVSMSLGGYSELGLCAYLVRYGKRLEGAEGRTWVTTHAFDLFEEFRGKAGLEGHVLPDKRQVGLSLRFTLDRPMPDAIPKLEPVTARATTR